MPLTPAKYQEALHDLINRIDDSRVGCDEIEEAIQRLQSRLAFSKEEQNEAEEQLVACKQNHDDIVRELHELELHSKEMKVHLEKIQTHMHQKRQIMVVDDGVIALRLKALRLSIQDASRQRKRPIHRRLILPVFFLFVMAIVSLYTTLWILSHLYTMVVGN